MNKLLIVMNMFLLFSQIEYAIGASRGLQSIQILCPDASSTTLKKADLNMFKKDSDSIYISIDDYLENKQKIDNPEGLNFQFAAFITDYVSFLKLQNYRNILNNEIIPEFQQFMNFDAPCELTGQYSKQNVNDYLTMLNDRLKLLQTLGRIGEISEISDKSERS